MAEQPADLVTTLEQAAVTAIRSQRRSLTMDSGQLRGITIELTLWPNGARCPSVKQADCYVQRRVTVADALGLRG